MRDLHITRLIETRTATGDDLRAMATLPLAARAHVLAHALALCAHTDADLRAGAVTLLSGATGIQALRAIVECLDDEDDRVRSAAVEALRVSARTQPYRMVHALYHSRVDVRRAALAGELGQAAQLASYLRADPACADLTVGLPWPAQRLPLVFDLYAQHMLSARALLDQLLLAGGKELLEALAHEHKRTQAQVSGYLSALWAGGPLAAPPGRDVFDTIVGAIVETTAFGHELAWVVQTLAAPGKDGPLLRERLLVSVLGHLARMPGPALWAAAVTLEPMLLARPLFAAAPAGTGQEIARLMFRTDWPVCVQLDEVVQLLKLPHVSADLALATALVGMLRSERITVLARWLGDEAILDALKSGDYGWSELCQLPHEQRSPLDEWLLQLRRWQPARASALEGIALSVLSGKRLDDFVTSIKSGARPAAFLALVARTALTATDDQLVTVLSLLAVRDDATDFDHALATLFDPSATPREHAIGMAVLRVFPGKVLATIAKKLSDLVLGHIVRAIDALPEIDALPREREVALAEIAITRGDADIVAWGKRMLSPAQVAPMIARQHDRARKVLSERDRARIATAPDDALETALGAALGTPTAGLADALGRRTARPSVVACAALLGAADPLPEVAAQLERYADDTPRFATELDALVVDTWYSGDEPLPPLAHARLWRWEAHTERFAAWVTSVGGLLAVLEAAEALPGELAAQTLWRGSAELLAFWRFRDRERYQKEASVELATFAALRVDGPRGVAAARLCVSLVEGGQVPISAIDNLLLDRAADASHATREHLARLIRLVGMPEPPPMRTPAVRPTDIVAMIRATRDPDALVRFLSDERQAVVEEAALALASLGGIGQRRLAETMWSLASSPHPLGLLATLPLWDDPEALAVVAVLARQESLPPEWRFHVALAAKNFEAVVAAVHAPVESTWFRKSHWQQLAEVYPARELARAVITAPPFHAYNPAVEILTGDIGDDLAADSLALKHFLDIGTERPIHLRRLVARILLARVGDAVGIPLLLAQVCESDTIDADNHILAKSGQPLFEACVRTIVDTALIAGQEACAERRMDHLTEAFKRIGPPTPELWPMLALRVLEYGQTKASRKTASAIAISKGLTDLRMMRIARIFAWGVRRGAELAGRKLTFHLTSEQRDLGHTYLGGNAVYVSALPMLRGEPNGEDIVEGLVLHEIGHHVYHRGEEPQRIWKQAHDEGLGHLLNLIADEHLERNLRAVNAEYGDRLKRLDAYAFRHAPQEIKIDVLVKALRGHTAAGLIGAELGVAFDESSVRMRRGAILGQLERAGHPLARFASALRMGLGNRHGDPLVAEALAIVQRDKELRKQDMAGMYELTKEIAALFGGATACAAVFGGPEGLVFGERDDDVFSGKIDDDNLQKEVERILDPRPGGRSREGRPNKLAINVNPNEVFNHITDVRKVSGRPAEHARLATEISRHADRLRSHLDDLGLRWLPVKGRTQGRALDRSRLRPLITHGDPRILQARTPLRRTDLFLGTLIDCSGSMSSGGNIERARKFGVLIAEAVRGLPGVDARFFGFTDRVVWDAGNSRDCGVTGLDASGGNNDAGALYHAASVAAASDKRARVLVMISDGLPTECSVAALRNLVVQLTRRRGMVCAQVAVRPLEEQCFPHYVLLDDAQIDVAVARFGRMIGDLVRRALGS